MKWPGRAVAVLASGPSLCSEDVDRVQSAGLLTIAVNSTWKVARFCDVIYAGDALWWRKYGHEVDIEAVRLSRSRRAEKQHGAKFCKTRLGSQYNSGMLAVEAALLKGASTVLMLGFDCSVRDGLHHHGPHEHSPNPNVQKCAIWKRQFENMAKVYTGRRVLNCSRYTELTCFPRMELGAALESLSQSEIHGPGEAGGFQEGAEAAGV